MFCGSFLRAPLKLSSFNKYCIEHCHCAWILHCIDCPSAWSSRRSYIPEVRIMSIPNLRYMKVSVRARTVSVVNTSVICFILPFIIFNKQTLFKLISVLNQVLNLVSRQQGSLRRYVLWKCSRTALHYLIKWAESAFKGNLGSKPYTPPILVCLGESSAADPDQPSGEHHPRHIGCVRGGRSWWHQQHRQGIQL